MAGSIDTHIVAHGGQTALCPKCPVDSVIGAASGDPITPEFLKLMHDHWFQKPKQF
jgi:hypothetical protein